MTMDVTVGISIRETFSRTIPSLKSMLPNLPVDVPIIFNSSGLPDDILKEVEALCKERPIKIIHVDCYLSPNQARNTIIQEADTKYIAFVDNDVEFGENWLEHLVKCAEEEGADIVSPLIFERRPLWKYVHLAGGEARILDGKGGTRICHEIHRFGRQDIETIEEPLERCPTELFEFHTVLIRRDFLNEIGLLDEKLLSVNEHWDVSITAKKMGRKVFVEPKSRVCYLPPSDLRHEDIRLFNLRWCDEWINCSIDRLVEKHDLTPELGNLAAVKGYVRWLRLNKYVKTRRFLKILFGAKAASVFMNRVVVHVDPYIINRSIPADLAKWRQYTENNEKHTDFAHIADQRTASRSAG